MALYIIVIAFLIIYIGFVVVIYRLDHRITELNGKVQQLKITVDEDYHGFAEDVVDLREKQEALEKALQGKREALEKALQGKLGAYEMALKDLTLRVDSLTPSKGFSGDLNTILNYQPSKMKRMKQKRGEE
jgi:uncharacterized protein YoxC